MLWAYIHSKMIIIEKTFINFIDCEICIAKREVKKQLQFETYQLKDGGEFKFLHVEHLKLLYYTTIK